ncbi:MAG: transposase [Variovorax sp.]|nr:MAG: transposase [Variovorax sp.]
MRGSQGWAAVPRCFIRGHLKFNTACATNLVTLASASPGPGNHWLHIGLQRWMNEQFDKRLVEPNSGLGKALRYLIRHWDALMLFLRKAGAPLDNNLCEQALKRAIIHRKGSLFFKTLSGAEVGDIYMSLIHTCRLCDVNPFEYLKALQQRAHDVIRHPARWLPWKESIQKVGVCAAANFSDRTYCPDPSSTLRRACPSVSR